MAIVNVQNYIANYRKFHSYLSDKNSGNLKIAPLFREKKSQNRPLTSGIFETSLESFPEIKFEKTSTKSVNIFRNF